MQDEDKLRERIQILLDNRQIFLIFLASSVILALVFSLGFVVGKRSSNQAVAPPPTDPLAMLDRMSEKVGEEEEDTLTFHEALTGDQLPEPPKAKQEAKVAAADAPTAGAKAAAAAEPAKEAVVDSPAAAKVAAAPAPVGQVIPPAAIQAAAAKVDMSDAIKPKKEAPISGSGGDYTLQLSAFQDKSEAEQFVASLKEAGFKPYMQATTIPGKGIWFRVRMGAYKTWDEAVEAKQRFEATKQIIAYVTRK